MAINSIINELKNILSDFDPITLDQMKDIRLMNRMDKKYMTRLARLPEILRAIAPLYFVQEVMLKRISPYSTVYFDTDDLRMFTMHHNSKRRRQKIRLRSYLDSGISFLEIKKKNNKGRTKKVRVQVDSSAEQVLGVQANLHFIEQESEYQSSLLLPQLENEFLRITLVNKAKTERLTIDLHIGFHNCVTGCDQLVNDLVIIELKTDGNVISPLFPILKGNGVYPSSISKYCLGTVLTNPMAKYNNFKRKLAYINKLTQNNYGRD